MQDAVFLGGIGHQAISGVGQRGFQQSAARKKLRELHAIKFRPPSESVAQTARDWRVVTIPASMQIHSGAARLRKLHHHIRGPQRRTKRIADAGLSAIPAGISFGHPVRTVSYTHLLSCERARPGRNPRERPRSWLD